MTEARLETFFIHRVRLLGGFSEKMAPTSVGIPDRLVILPGGIVRLVELKTDSGRLSPAQREWHKRAAQRGVLVATVYGEAGVVAWLREALKGPASLDDDDDGPTPPPSPAEPGTPAPPRRVLRAGYSRSDIDPDHDIPDPDSPPNPLTARWCEASARHGVAVSSHVHLVPRQRSTALCGVKVARAPVWRRVRERKREIAYRPLDPWVSPSTARPHCVECYRLEPTTRGKPASS